MTLWKWSTTSGSNANSDSTINWAEGQAPSSVNDSARAMMAAVAKYRDDIAGTITTGGTSTAYTVTSNQVFGSLANMSGKTIAFIPHATNGATVTLNVDGLGAKPLRSIPGVNGELGAGVLIQGTPYLATYYNTAGEWIVMGIPGAQLVPLGALLDYTGPSAPNSHFVLPFGQAISRTTYTTYFALVGTAFGTGDGSTTFNVPDLRGRLVAGKDDMGGSAASRITGAAGAPTGTQLGAAGGSETQMISQANLPNVNFSAASLSISNGTNIVQVSGPYYNANDGTGTSHINVPQQASSVTLTVSGSVPSGGSGTAIGNTQPMMILNKILRVL
jgi:microcystin-dependent protein